jgi:protein-S-isoprenylcysteine O-methyltransferase Ste14
MDFGTFKRVWLPLALAAWGMWIVLRMPYVPQGPRRWIGMAIAFSGLAGVLVARYTLGKSFSVRAKATALVTSGIYSRIRNPIYVSGIIFLIGIAIMLGKPIVLLILVLIIPMQIWRARNEAKVLEDRFGEEYRTYRRRTWF